MEKIISIPTQSRRHSKTSTPILKRGDLHLVSYEQDHLKSFSVSRENRKELRHVYRIRNLEDAMIEVASEGLCFSVIRGNETLAILGITPEDEDTGFLWALFSSELKKHWVSFVRASPMLIRFLHKISKNIVVEVWDQNREIMQWLSFLGFEAAWVNSGVKNKKIKRIGFVRCNSDSHNVYAGASRPVQH